ncbi:hypothetical protein ACKUVQ_10855 [Mycobacterium seoulense]|uniref:hypothetical protein n=1 Tax=Mycobacterium seoulense TaxID=386911 RepID=UPI003CFA0102
MASEIVLALISGGTGFATGAVGSLFAPWANWGIEKRRLRRTSRVDRISQWRSGVAMLRRAEPEHGIPQQVAKPASLGDRITERYQYITRTPDPDLVDVYTKPWFRQLRRELSRKTLRQIAAMTAQPVQQRIGDLPDRLEEEINRLERDKWHLV